MATTDNEVIYLPLENVDSEHCAMIVDNGLAKVKGVANHKVELNNNRAAITVNTKEAVADAVHVIKRFGIWCNHRKKIFSGAEYDLCILCHQCRKYS